MTLRQWFTPIVTKVYLRQWADQLDAPILSVDYSLAPEHKFPRAIEDIFFSYCWALNNPHLLGMYHIKPPQYTFRYTTSIYLYINIPLNQPPRPPS